MARTPDTRSARGDVALWPFDGPLDELLERSRIVTVETYPAAFYGRFGLQGAKGVAVDRAANAPALLRAAARFGVELDPQLADEANVGFATDDHYDALVGLLGMIEVVRGEAEAGEPRDDEAIAHVEGWMLGR